MLKEYLSTLANAMRSKLGSTTKINAQDFADKIGEVYDKGLLDGLAQAKAEGRKTEYIEESFTGSKQYLTYSIDFEPELIIFQSNDGDATIEANKPDFQTNNLNIPNMIFSVNKGFAEGQNYKVASASVWRYKKDESTLNKVFSTIILTNYTFNQTTGKWDVTLGREDSSTSNTRFVSGGQVPIQVLFVGKAEPSVLEGTVTITENTKELKIEGLPKAPKTLNLIACNASTPQTEDVRWIRGLDYVADGFYYGTSTTKVLVCAWLACKVTETNTTGAGNGSISEKMVNNYNLITFEDGTFTLKMSDNNIVYYGENFTYKWIATF